MDVSLREPPGTLRTTPVLRIVATRDLLLHEDPESGRVDRLCEALPRDGVLRNPPIVTPGPDGRMVVLDGANRATALARLGIRYAVAQVVDYARPDIRISTWRHHVHDDGRLRPRAARMHGARALAPFAIADAEAALAAGRAAAFLADRKGVMLIGERGGAEASGPVSELVALYRGAYDVHRVESGTPDRVDAEYGRGTLVVFPSFAKEDIVRLALGAGRLPAGITRHLVPGRALRINVPLDWLDAASDAAHKQAELDAMMQRRRLAHGVRYYEESTFLFDE